MSGNPGPAMVKRNNYHPIKIPQKILFPPIVIPQKYLFPSFNLPTPPLRQAIIHDWSLIYDTNFGFFMLWVNEIFLQVFKDTCR